MKLNTGLANTSDVLHLFFDEDIAYLNNVHIVLLSAICGKLNFYSKCFTLPTIKLITPLPNSSEHIRFPLLSSNKSVSLIKIIHTKLELYKYIKLIEAPNKIPKSHELNYLKNSVDLEGKDAY